jgi:ribonuclease D
LKTNQTKDEATPMTITLHKGDLPDDVTFSGAVAVDTEAMGLNHHRDPLCVVQLSSGDGNAHVVQLDRKAYQAPNLEKLLTDPNIIKIFHFARFDVAGLKTTFDVVTTPIFCTKIASKIARTYTDQHGLKSIAKEILGVDLSKQQQSSDWGSETLTEAQLTYAASDVLYLHKLMDQLIVMLKREGRYELAASCFDFLPTRASLDLGGWEDVDIFHH